MLPIYPLTADQIEIRELAKDFANREIRPNIQLCEKKALSQTDLLEKICQSGLINIRIPEDFGGLGLSLFDTCLIAEEFAAVCSGVNTILEASEIAISYLLSYGSVEQKVKYLGQLTQENGLAGIALNNIQDKSKKRLYAQKKANSIVLNGECSIVLNASFAKWLIIACPFLERQPKNSQCFEQLAIFIVPTNSKGLTYLDSISFLGKLAANICAVQLNNVELELAAKINISKNLSIESASFVNILDINPAVNAAIIASGCLGLASSAFNHSRLYSKQRETFGVPIAKHQAIAFMLADMDSDLEALRMMRFATLESIHAHSQNLKLAYSTLSFALDSAVRISNDAVQIFGGYGYTKDYPVEKLMRDAKTYQALYGVDKKEYLGRKLIS
jgi:acyl-CoA dehydrogenase